LTIAVGKRILKVIAGTIPGTWTQPIYHDDPGEQ
jgi:hypothetical protein